MHSELAVVYAEASVVENRDLRTLQIFTLRALRT